MNAGRMYAQTEMSTGQAGGWNRRAGMDLESTLYDL